MPVHFPTLLHTLLPHHERKPRRDSGSPLAPYADYLSQRWDQGCHKGLQLWRAVCEQGYRGPRSAIWPVLHLGVNESRALP